MKKKFLVIAFVLSFVFLLTGCGSTELYYKGHKTLNLIEALSEEQIELENEDYKETDDQAIIYLFRGNGCGYCRAFLTFLSSISKDYGSKFKLVSFEVWNDAANNDLMKEVANQTGEAAGGVPYIIIGDKVFPGYISSWDEDIKAQIDKQYKDNSYDVFKEMQKGDGFGLDSDKLFSFSLIAVATVVIVLVSNSNTKKVLNELENKHYSKGNK